MLSPLDSVPFSTLLFVILIAGAAGLARGFSGFGAALIFMPAASALITPALAAPILLMADGILALGFIPKAWTFARKQDVAVMALGAAVGIPTGAYVLNYANPLHLRWFIAILAFAMLALLASGWRYEGKPRRPVTVLVGAIAGFCGGVAQLTGPPVVAYWLSGQEPPHIVRVNIILFFACTTLFTVVSYLAAGLLTQQAVLLALMVGPLYAVGLFLGSKLFGRVSETLFRRLCFLLIAVSVVTSLPVWR